MIGHCKALGVCAILSAVEHNLEFWVNGGEGEGTSELLTVSRFRHKQHPDGTLVIESLTSKDSGVYTCTASTQQQMEQSQLQLRVQSTFQL